MEKSLYHFPLFLVCALSNILNVCFVFVVTDQKIKKIYEFSALLLYILKFIHFLSQETGTTQIKLFIVDDKARLVLFPILLH